MVETEEETPEQRRRRLANESRRRWEQANPEKYQAMKAKWRATHREQRTAANHEWRKKQRQENGEEYRAKRAAEAKAWRDANKERINARERELDAAKRREEGRKRSWRRAQLELNEAREVATMLAGKGLPPRRLHRSSTEEKMQHAAEATRFYTDPTLAERVKPQKISAHERARRAKYAAPAWKFEPKQKPKSAAQLAREAEEARMDEIAREINRRLRIVK